MRINAPYHASQNKHKTKPGAHSMAAFIKETRIHITSTNEIIIKQQIKISTRPEKKR